MINDDEDKTNKIQRQSHRTNQNNVLIVLCTVCSTPLGFPTALEKEILHSVSLICPICKQKSVITKELKNYIIKS